MPNEDEIVLETTEETQEQPTVEEKPKAEKPKRTPEEELAYFEGRAQRLRKDLGIETEKPKTQGELDDAAYALLTAKGYEAQEDIDLITKMAKKWDLPVREALKDEDLLNKLKGQRIEREVRGAMPSASNRTGQGATDDVSYWVEKNARTGELPKDFELRAKVVEAKEGKYGNNKPSWRS